MSDKVTIIEVGPRDGLQNEPMFVETEDKINWILQLCETGLRHIEITSFVSPKAIPQFVDQDKVAQTLMDRKVPNVHFSALVPNEKGMQKALTAGIQDIAIFTAASETFNQRNINCSIQASIERFKPVMQLAKSHQIPVRAYISCVIGCPYEGAIPPKQVLKVSEQLLALGVDELSLGDTIGIGTAKQTEALLKDILSLVPVNQIAMHFHDTYGQAIANILTSLHLGIRRFDSAIAGLGGCPYARGATGNVATEDVLYLMQGLNLETGIDLLKIVAAGDSICKALGRPNQSRVANALIANPCS